MEMQEQIEQLRRQVRWLMVGGALGVGVIAIFILGGFQSAEKKRDAVVIQAQSFQVVDKRGNVQAELSSDGDNTFLKLRGHKNQPGMMLGISDDFSEISFWDKKANKRMVLNATDTEAGIVVVDNRKNVKIAIGSEKMGSFIKMQEPNVCAIGLATNFLGTGLHMFDDQGKPRLELFSGKGAETSLTISDENQKARIQLNYDKNTSRISMYDEFEKTISNLISQQDGIILGLSDGPETTVSMGIKKDDGPMFMIRNKNKPITMTSGKYSLLWSTE